MIRLPTDPAEWASADFEPAIVWLRAGNVVALPTDTAYGLSADPTSEAAVQRVFDVKERPAGLALPLIAGSLQQVEALCGPLTGHNARLAARFWPGPLSLVLDAPLAVASLVHGGRRSIAIRVPAHPVARRLCLAWWPA